MVVFGQPKTSAEYIQATSRVGRDENRPGLVVTIYNVHKPRDRSHYERFEIYHETFYRSVEVTSVTPFSPRALDKGLAGTVVGLARHSLPPMTPPAGAAQILAERGRLDFVVDTLAERALGRCTLAARGGGSGAAVACESERSICSMSGARRRMELGQRRRWACSTTRRKPAARSRCYAISSVPI